jgi:hypothetical protein
VLTATDDRARVAVVLSLEAIGAEFFGRAIGFLDRTRGSSDLKYFARPHQQVESAHRVFEDENQRQIDSIGVPSSAWNEVTRAIDNTFDGMTRLGADLHAVFLGTA